MALDSCTQGQRAAVVTFCALNLLQTLASIGLYATLAKRGKTLLLQIQANRVLLHQGYLPPLCNSILIALGTEVGPCKIVVSKRGVRLKLDRAIGSYDCTLVVMAVSDDADLNVVDLGPQGIIGMREVDLSGRPS